MDNNQEGRVHFADKNLCHCGWRHHEAWHVLKWLIVLLLIVTAFNVGTRVGGRVIFERNGIGPSMMTQGVNMMGWGGRPTNFVARADQVFGTISQVSGPMITISDNGGKSQAIVSTSTTMIVIGNQELGLSALKVGQTIRAIGSLDSEGKLTAKVIYLTSL